MAKVLTSMGNYSIRNSKKIISLDQFMTDYFSRTWCKQEQCIDYCCLAGVRKKFIQEKEWRILSELRIILEIKL